MKMTTVGIDLAKNVIQVHGVDERGKAVLRKPLKREQVASFFATLPPLPDRHGSLRQRASLGEEAGSVRAYRKADGPAVRQTLRDGGTGTDRIVAYGSRVNIGLSTFDGSNGIWIFAAVALVTSPS